MANDPLRRAPQRPVPPPSDRPKIWAEGQQRPSLSWRGLRQASVCLARDAVAPLNAWAARTMRRVAVNVSNGAGRIPEGKLGRAERFVPSHLRVAGWIKNTAAVLAHASAVADTDAKRGNALVAEIEPHLWPAGPADTPAPSPPKAAEPEASPFGADALAPVILAEPLATAGVAPDPKMPDPEIPEPVQPEVDLLAAIRDDLGGTAQPARKAKAARTRPVSQPALPPDPPGPFANTVIQVTGYLIGWGTVIIALPYGLIRSLWLWQAGNVDLRRVGKED
jgi:hypothetical protein